MSLPEPKAGAVIRYAYLWKSEAESGREEGAKDRPAAIVLSKTHDETGAIQVAVAPVTHSPPDDPETSIKIPPNVCKELGLDGESQWLRADEVNRFMWPGYDLRPIPGRDGEYSYGMLPRALYEDLRTRILKLDRSRKLSKTNRD